MSELEEVYKQKYLKYKAKYMELKRIEQEGGFLDNGFAIVFTTTSNADDLKREINAGKISGKGGVATLLHRKGYIIFDGNKSAELLEDKYKIMGDAVKSAAKSAASSTASVATIAYKATTNAAAQAASATVKAAVAVKDSAVDQYNKYQKQKQKAAEDKAAFALFKAQSTPYATLVGGADLPLKLPTLNNKSFDRANDNHKKEMAAAVAVALGIDFTEVAMVTIKFKTFGKPEIRD